MELVKKESGLQTSGESANIQDHYAASSSSKEVKVIRCSTKLSHEKFSYTWKLHDFNEIPFISGYPIFSANFYINKTNSSRWQIVMTKHTSLHKNCNDEGDYDSISEDESETVECGDKDCKHEKTNRIGFRLEKCESTPQIWDSVKYSFTVKTSSGTTVSTEEREEPGLTSYHDTGKVPRYAFLTEKEFGEGNLFDEKYLEVTCHVNYSYHDVSMQEPVSYEGKRFVEDLRMLFVSKRYADVSLNVNGELFDTAHKIILHAAYPGLEKLLENQDQQRRKVDLEIDSDAMKAMVDFIYSGKIEGGFPVKKCAPLLDAANLYGVDCLDQYIMDYLKNNVKVGH